MVEPKVITCVPGSAYTRNHWLDILGPTLILLCVPADLSGVSIICTPKRHSEFLLKVLTLVFETVCEETLPPQATAPESQLPLLPLEQL